MILRRKNPERNRGNAMRKNFSIESQRESLLSISYLFAFRRNNREITFPGTTAIQPFESSRIRWFYCRVNAMVSPILVDCFVRANQDNSAKEFVKSFTRGRVYTHSPLSVSLPTKNWKKGEGESEKEDFLCHLEDNYWLEEKLSFSFSLFLSPSPLEAFN